MAWTAIPKWCQTQWKKWDIRICILSSLLTQVILVFISPRRKRMSRRYVTISTWFAYLLADAVAIFCIGLISNVQGEEGNQKLDDLHAFWAPFLLLHLGGPDTITAFALEDNQLWIRHLMNLAMQSAAVIYAILQTLPQNQFRGPMCLILAVGLFKYAERSYALYLASLSSFRESLVNLIKPDPGPNYARLMYEFAWMKENEVAARIITLQDPETNQDRNSSTEEESNMDQLQGSNSSHNPDDLVMVERAYEFFNKFKGLIVDLIYNFHDRDDSRRFFLDISEEEKAYRMIEIELSFIYDVLYTKAPILHSRKGYIHRLIGFTSIVAAFVLFGFSNKDKLHHIDVGVTYALLTAAVFLEIIAFLNLIFSDWTIVLLKKLDSNSKFSKSVKSLVRKIVQRGIFFKKSRWSESIAQFSLLNFCLCKRPEWMQNAVEYLRLQEFLDASQYKSHTPLSPKIKKLIFQELKKKSEKAKDLPTTKEICSSRGMYILKDCDNKVKDILSSRFQVEYDASLLMWHIATDILYHQNVVSETDINDREVCKTLSDYMLYLLVIQPTAISAVASVAQTSYRDTCAEAEKFFREFQSVGAQPETNEAKSQLKLIGKLKLKAGDEELKKACMKLLQVDTSIKPSEMKGDQSKSVFFDGVMLAKDLLELVPGKWKIMSKVWVELLCYSAGHCRATNHAQHVSKGGELITLVWLLMVHFGLAEQFSILAVHGEANFVLRK